MVESVVGQGGREWEARYQNDLSYADDGMIASLDLEYLQGALSTLVGLFYWVGLRTNVWKTIGIVCRPCQAVGSQSEVPYERWMTGTGLSS